MKTAMQELIEWMGKNDYYGTGVFYAANNLLEKEKEQIEETFDNGFYHALYCRADETQLDGEDYYNEKYNQNK